MYHLQGRQFRSVLGGIPNVPIDAKGTLEPLDNKVEIITTHPFAKYVLKRGPFSIGFHDKINNKYGSAIKLRTGETLIKRAVGDPVCSPTVIDGRILQWKYGNGSWIREYVTEKHIKEILFQKAGQVVKFRYTLNGLTAKKTGNKFEIYRGDKKAFSIQRSYYFKLTNGIQTFVSYVPAIWEKVGNDWVVTYPAPTENKYIDPSVVFGTGIGVGDHKDTLIYEGGTNNSFGDLTTLYARNWVGTTNVSLIRFSLNSLPIYAKVNTAVLSLTLAAVAVTKTQFIADLVTNWGITNFNPGIANVPAAANEACWSQPFFGAANWGGGGVFTAADYLAAENTFDVTLGESVGTVYNINIPIMAQRWIQNNATNYGLALGAVTSANTSNQWDSEEGAVIAERPYLTIDWTLFGNPYQLTATVTGVPSAPELERLFERLKPAWTRFGYIYVP